MDSKLAVPHSAERRAVYGRVGSVLRLAFNCFFFVGGSFALFLTTALYLDHQKPYLEGWRTRAYSDFKWAGEVSQTLRLQAREKVNRIYLVDQDNAQLRLENAVLRENLEDRVFRKMATHDEKISEKIAQQQVEKTGSQTGRSTKDFQFTPPEQLLPFQVQTLAIAFLKEQNYEKAASLFTSLLEHKDTQFQTAQTYLAAGVAWYKVDNYTQAELYFNEALLKAKTDPQKESLEVQCRLWKALIAHSLNKKVHAQYWLNEVLDHHPKSEEASWVNVSPTEIKQPVQEGQVQHE